MSGHTTYTNDLTGPCNGVFADTDPFSHRACRPMRRPIFGPGMERVPNDLVDRRVRDLGWPATSGPDPAHTRYALNSEPGPPPSHRLRRCLRASGDLLIRDAVARKEQGPSLTDLTVRQRMGTRHRLKLTALLGRYPQRFGSSNHPPTLHRIAISATDH